MDAFQSRVLRLVAQYGPVTAREIAFDLTMSETRHPEHVDESRVREALRKLERWELVRKTLSDNGRARLTEITARGREVDRANIVNREGWEQRAAAREPMGGE